MVSSFVLSWIIKVDVRQTEKKGLLLLLNWQGRKKCEIGCICSAALTSGPDFVQRVDFWGTQTLRTALENDV